MFELFKNLIKDVFGGIYDFSKVTILIKNIIVEYVMSISIEFDVAGANKVKGFCGENGYNLDPDRAGVLKIKVSDCSPDNYNLMQINFGQNGIVGKNFVTRILDANGGGTSYYFTGCRIMNRPNQPKGEEIADLEYVIGFTNFEVYANGVKVEDCQQLLTFLEV